MACFKNSIQNKAQIDSDFFLPIENSNTALVTLKSDTTNSEHFNIIFKITHETNDSKKNGLFLHFL